MGTNLLVFGVDGAFIIATPVVLKNKKEVMDNGSNDTINHNSSYDYSHRGCRRNCEASFPQTRQGVRQGYSPLALQGEKQGG